LAEAPRAALARGVTGVPLGTSLVTSSRTSRITSASTTTGSTPGVSAGAAALAPRARGARGGVLGVSVMVSGRRGAGRAGSCVVQRCPKMLDGGRTDNDGMIFVCPLQGFPVHRPTRAASRASVRHCAHLAGMFRNPRGPRSSGRRRAKFQEYRLCQIFVKRFAPAVDWSSTAAWAPCCNRAGCRPA